MMTMMLLKVKSCAGFDVLYEDEEATQGSAFLLEMLPQPKRQP